MHIFMQCRNTTEAKEAITKFLESKDVNVIDVKISNAEEGKYLPNVVTLTFTVHNSKTEADTVIETKDFSCGFNGTGPRDFLEVLRAMGITADMLSDEEVFSKKEGLLGRCFSTVSIGKIKEIL